MCARGRKDRYLSPWSLPISSPTQPIQWASEATAVASVRWVSSTPLGTPVVPLVYMMVQMSSLLGGAAPGRQAGGGVATEVVCSWG